MRISIGRKVSLTLKAVVAATVVAIVATYFVSANAIRAIRASQQASQAMLAASADMEADVVFAGLRVFQYLESGDPYYLDAYREHSRHFQRDAEHLLAHNDFAAGRDAVRQVAEQYRALDQVSRDVISNHDRMNREIEAVLKHLPRLRAASAALVEGAPAGSTQYALGKKIETTRTQMFDALLDFIYRDRGDGSVAARLADLRGLLEDYDKLALPAAHKTLAAELTAALQALSAALNEALQFSQAKRDQMTKMLLQQRQIISAIHTRVNPALKLHAQETDRKADTRMRQVLYAAGAIALLLALLAILTGRYLRRAIVTPIQALAHGANRVAGGHLDHRVAITTDDEYADLANNFNHMVGQLQGSMVSRAQHEAQASQLRALLDGVHDYAIFSVDEQGYVTNWNTASTHILGYAAQDMEGVSFARIFKDSEQARTVRDKALAGIAASGRFETNSSVVRAGGEAFEANIVVTPLRADDGALKGYTVVVCDITERLKAERHIERLATTDTLTGLANRNMLLQQLNAAVARAARSHLQLAMMFIDLDNFKTVNDTLGHAAGDDLLRECAKRLTQCVRQGDVVARLGGDEFVVLLTDVTAGSIVTPVADRMLRLLAQPYQLHGQETQTTASIGICFYPADGEDATVLMKNADIAMYHAKEQNRNNYQFYAEEMNQRMLQRAQLERELRTALENHEFVLHYQPQVAIESGKIRGVESLIRWQHPQRGLLAPDKFIPVAEETGLIVPIGDWVLDHVCLTIKAWRANGVDIPYIGVNVSAVQLNQDLVASVRQALVTHGIAPGWLMLEITETMLMERVDEAIAILRRIRELGVRIAMDDFGTGYSSLSVLQRLPLDALKIDRSFVRGIDDEKDNTRAIAIISAMIAIAKELDLTVVAEGVETPTQLAFLRTLNCDTYQGYLFSKPVDTMSLQARFAAPAKSVLEDENGRAITLTTKVTLELNNGAGS